jgi:dipeptidyl aminopeptidase/acylaminoacyl peptidase
LTHISRALLRLTRSLLVLVLLLLASCSKSPTQPPDDSALSVDNSPAWSPAANLVAFQRYVSSTLGPAGLYTVSPRDSSIELISTRVFDELDFSPDGTKLAAILNGDVAIVDLSTGVANTVLVTDNIPRHPTWSPDGRYLSYTRIGRDAMEPTDSAGLHLLDLSTGHDLALQHAGTSISAGSPRWSPTDSLITYAGNDGIYTVTPSGATLRRLTSPSRGVYHLNPRWSRSGAFIFFTELGSTRRTLRINVGSGAIASWPLYLGEYNAFAPLDSAYVFAGLDPTSPVRALTLFTRHPADAAGSSTRQLTHYAQP